MSTPQEFDVDAWIADAERPARSVTVYQKAGLIADLDRLGEQINNADDEDVDGPSMGGGVGKLRAKYAKLAQQFHESGLTLRIEGRDEDEKRVIVKANEGLEPTQMGYAVIADAITSHKISGEQLGKLAAKVGEVQFNRVIAMFHEACTAIPAVSADFLPKRSTPDDGGES